VRSLAWSPDGKRLATASDDGTVKVWQVSGGREVCTLMGHTNSVIAVSWSPDGERLASGSSDGTAKVWEAATGRSLLTLKGHTNQVTSVCWSPDSRRLATASDDGTARVWEVASGRELLVIKGHTKEVRSVSWSPDGQRLATGSYDGTAKVWDAIGGRELLTLKGQFTVWSVCWSPDGQRLATGSSDSTARVWEAASAQAVDEWARQDRALKDLLARSAFRGPEATGFIQTWLLLVPLPLAQAESGAQALDRQQLQGEANLKPLAGYRARFGNQEYVWQEHRSPQAVMNFNAVVGRVTERSVVYAVCYLQCEQARHDLWLQVGSDDQAKVYLNGREIYQYRFPHALRGLDTVGPVALKQGTNVLVFKVVNEGGGWEGCVRLVDDADLPAKGVRVKVRP
jgi:hypothetical protein